jgi:DNA-binding NarL/FixJ family response regulator
VVGNNNGLFGSSSRRCALWFADDHPAILNGLEGVFRDALHRPVIHSFCSADTLLEKLQHQQNITKIKKCTPDVIFLDCSMPGTTGIDAIQPILRCAPSARIIMFTQYDYAGFIEHAFQNGAYGYVLKSSETALLLTALQTVMQGKKYIDPSIAADVRKVAGLQPAVKSGDTHYNLTQAEMNVLNCLLDGLPIKDIAEKQFITYNTVNFHIKNLHKKLNVQSTRQLIVKVLREK